MSVEGAMKVLGTAAFKDCSCIVVTRRKNHAKSIISRSRAQLFQPENPFVRPEKVLKLQAACFLPFGFMLRLLSSLALSHPP